MGMIYFLLGIICFAGSVLCKPNGSPQESCFYMTPRHIHPHTFRKVFPTRAMGLYNITTSADVFRPDRPIRVTLWGPPFKGFMLVAAEEGAKDWPTGIFYSEDGAGKRLNCLGRGDTVTHQNNSYKDSVSVLWYGPETMMSENIQFVATVVVNLTIYYTNIRSGFVRLDPALAPVAAGGENSPIAVTMDPWLSGNSITQAPTNWWSRGGSGGGGGGLNGLASLLGGGSSGSSGGSWGSNSWSSGGSGRSGGPGGGSSWGGSSNWGSSQGPSRWGDGSSSGPSSGSGGSRWGSGSQGSQGSQGSGNSGSWQQWGNGGSPTSNWQYQNPGSNQPSNPGGAAFDSQGNSVWTWNSGPTTETPPGPQKNQPPPSQQPASSSGGQGGSGGGSSGWSASSIVDILRGIVSSPTSSA